MITNAAALLTNPASTLVCIKFSVHLTVASELIHKGLVINSANIEPTNKIKEYLILR